MTITIPTKKKRRRERHSLILVGAQKKKKAKTDGSYVHDIGYPPVKKA